MMGYKDFIELSGLISNHDQKMDEIRKSIDNYQAICEIARKECDEKIAWAMDRIYDLNAKMDKLNKEYMDECEAVYRKYRDSAT